MDVVSTSWPEHGETILVSLLKMQSQMKIP
jgi:hypothetical protein